MKGLRALREASNYSQHHLAEMLNTTQQTIARWEGGKAEPNLAALRDLALIFGVSVDDLLGVSPLSRKPQSTHYHLFSRGAQDGFWGHVGLKLDDGPSKWFPVTSETSVRIRAQLAGIETEGDWITFPTLANKYVAFRPTAIRKTWLLDDACDGPEGDWENELPYAGLPLEMYRAFARMGDLPIGEAAWERALAALPRESDAGESVDGDPEAWREFLADLAESFDGEASSTFLSSVAATFGSMQLYKQERFFQDFHYTSIYLVEGAPDRAWIEARQLKDFLFDVDLGSPPHVISLEHFGGDAETFYSASRVSALIMPLIDLLDAWKSDEDVD